MDRDQDEQWTVERLRAALEHLPGHAPVSVCLPGADGTLVFAPLVDATHDAQFVVDLPGLELLLYGARDDSAVEAALSTYVRHAETGAFTPGIDVVVPRGRP